MNTMSGHRVLVVDDRPENIQLMQAILRMCKELNHERE